MLRRLLSYTKPTENEKTTSPIKEIVFEKTSKPPKPSKNASISRPPKPPRPPRPPKNEDYKEPKKEKIRRPKKKVPKRTQVDRAPSFTEEPKLPTRTLSAIPHRAKRYDNQNTMSSIPPRINTGAAKSSIALTRSTGTASSPQRSSLKRTKSLPPPKSPIRFTLQRKASKPPPKRTKSLVVKEIEETYNEDGTLQRTTIRRTRKPDGSCSTEKHKKHLCPSNPDYRPQMTIDIKTPKDPKKKKTKKKKNLKRKKSKIIE